jgi:hypothetical protein
VANPAVSRAALKAIGAWSAVVLEDDDTRVLKPLIPPMVELCRSAAGVADEDTVCVAFQIWYEMIEASSTVVNAELGRILELALAAATSASMEPETRISALNLVGAALMHKKKALLKAKLVPALTAKLFEACAAVDDDDDDDSGGAASSVHKSSAQILHTLGTHLPSKHAVPAVLEQVRLHHASAHDGARRASLVALAMTAEGCGEAYCASLDALLPVVYAGCNDSVQIVREAACITIGQFAQYLQPEIIEHYEQVLPHIFMVRAPSPPPRTISAASHHQRPLTLSPPCLPTLPPCRTTP